MENLVQKISLSRTYDDDDDVDDGGVIEWRKATRWSAPDRVWVHCFFFSSFGWHNDGARYTQRLCMYVWTKKERRCVLYKCVCVCACMCVWGIGSVFVETRVRLLIFRLSCCVWVNCMYVQNTRNVVFNNSDGDENEERSYTRIHDENLQTVLCFLIFFFTFCRRKIFMYF